MKRYRKRPDSTITAVQINVKLITNRILYFKWGDRQQAKQGDWLVNNNGDCYTIDQKTFAQTYEMVSPGVYFKKGEVWAHVASDDGRIATKEGLSEYKAGDYIVYNNSDYTDGYCITAKKFESMYEEAA